MAQIIRACNTHDWVCPSGCSCSDAHVVSRHEGWIYYAFKTNGLTKEELTDVLHQLIIDKRPVDREILEKIIDMDGSL